MITTDEMRKMLHDDLKEIAESKTYREIAIASEVTERTVATAMKYPQRLKIETLERIVRENQ